jgi:hypothetical protein
LVKNSIMKYIAYISLIAAIVFVAACNKESATNLKSVTNAKSTSALPGNWTLVENLLDPGDGSGTWQHVTTSTTLGLNADGTVSGTFIQNATYIVKDSVTLTFTQNNGAAAPAFGDSQNYRYQLRHDTLEMSPDGPARCIEACGIRFKKDK